MVVHTADLLEDDEARQLGQVQVEDDEVRLLLFEELDPALAVEGLDDVVSLAPQGVVQQLDEVAIVVDDQQLQVPTSSASSRALGIVKCTDVPRSRALSIRMSPP